MFKSELKKFRHKSILFFLCLTCSVGLAMAQLPTAPTNLVARPTNEGAVISFTAPANDGGSPITHYEYSLDGGSTWFTQATPVTASPFVFSSQLTNCAPYNIKLRAVNSSGSGEASATVQVTPDAIRKYWRKLGSAKKCWRLFMV